jgi:hypothetical protein
MTDPLLERADTQETQDAQKKGGKPEADRGRSEGAPTRQRFKLEDDMGFDEVPKKYRRFYRRWQGEGDSLAANEVICPVCKIVIRSARELWEGDRVYCMPCMTRMIVAEGPDGGLVGEVSY